MAEILILMAEQRLASQSLDRGETQALRFLIVQVGNQLKAEVFHHTKSNTVHSVVCP